MSSKTNPLVLFPIDAIDWFYCQEYIAKGLMPNLQSLMNDSSYGVLKDKDSICELGLFNIMFTGQSREEIGYYDFRQIIPGSYKLKNHVEGEDFGDDPFWSSYKGTDKKICILDVYDARIVNDVKGVQLAHWTLNNMKRNTIVYPETLADIYPELKIQLKCNQIIPADDANSLHVFTNLLKRLDQKLETYSKIIQSEDFDFIAIGFGEAHCAGHQFFDYLNYSTENTDDNTKLILSEAIEKIYQKIDFLIGEFISILPEKSNIVVISNVGIDALYPYEMFINRVCSVLGYQVFKKKSLLQAVSPLNLGRKIVPLKVRYKLRRLFIDINKQDQDLANSFENSTDWSKTKIFASPTFFNLYLRVNLKGREEQGIVDIKDYDEFVDKVCEQLKGFVDEETNQPIFKEIIKAKGVFSEDIPFNNPDILASFNSSTNPVKSISHKEGYRIVQEENFFFRSTEHSEYGFFIAKGPDVKINGEIKNVNYRDIAPTLVNLAGIKNDVNYVGNIVF
jgi:predicted AlkP superfamily phosphohydrolase/phosphomutase